MPIFKKVNQISGSGGARAEYQYSQKFIKCSYLSTVDVDKKIPLRGNIHFMKLFRLILKKR